MNDKKICSKCLVEKELSCFEKQRNQCRKCRIELKKTFPYYAEDKRAARRLRDKDKINAQQREHYKKYRKEYIEYRCEQFLKKSYGINRKEYNLMLYQQNNKCAICYREYKEGAKRFAVDHNHKTGKIRGILCDLCNRGIGLLRDDIEVLKNAITYLKKDE